MDIAKARLNAGLSLKRAAMLLGLKQKTLHAYEDGKTIPDDVLNSMCKVYGADIKPPKSAVKPYYAAAPALVEL